MRSFALFTAAILASIASAACIEGRFPTCQDNAECAARDAGARGSVCYNLRCVECRYDVDCPAGHVCSSANACQSLRQGGSGEDSPSAWDVNNWDECAKRCKDPSCIHQCDVRFKK